MPYHAIARAFLAGDLSVDQLIARATNMVGRPSRWIARAARSFVKTFPPDKSRPRLRGVVKFLQTQRLPKKLAIDHWLTESPSMQPVPAAAGWPIPPLATAKDLADWLELTLPDLEWFAELHGVNRKSNPRLRHYHYRVLTKQSGTLRLIEAPKLRLKAIQRKILSGILEKIPPHPSVHGFLKGRSIKTFVAPHTGQRVVLKMDLEDFFPSISAARVQALFRTIGYPEPVADLLGGLSTTIAPRDIWKPRDLYSQAHLPQGAPTSPMLANLCAYRADCRLSALAQSVGAIYTRYADDLAFSGPGPFARSVHRFQAHAAAILYEHGFSVNHRKTRIMRQSVRQHLAALVANDHPNILRTDYDRLKATLTNCIRHGPATQNRDAHENFPAHLQGKIAWVESINQAKGARLRALFTQIPWP
jgi:RNA-directed DNA polymerase